MHSFGACLDYLFGTVTGIGCHLRWPLAPHKLNFEFTSQTWSAAHDHASSRLFSGRKAGPEGAAEIEPRLLRVWWLSKWCIMLETTICSIILKISSCSGRLSRGWNRCREGLQFSQGVFQYQTFKWTGCIYEILTVHFLQQDVKRTGTMCYKETRRNWALVTVDALGLSKANRCTILWRWNPRFFKAVKWQTGNKMFIGPS